MTRIVNLTAVTLNVMNEQNEVIRSFESAGLATVATTQKRIGQLDGIPVYKTKFGVLDGLPALQEDTVYIVSSLAAQAVPEREDVFIPNEPVRGENGRIIGCRSFARI